MLVGGCGRDSEPPTPSGTSLPNIKMIGGEETYTVALHDNTTAEKFFQLLPLTLDMSELNNNEKYHYLPTTLPTNKTYPRTIHRGDIMLYGDNCIVVFYETFTTAYAYSPIGQIVSPEGLKTSLGTGNVTITFTK